MDTYLYQIVFQFDLGEQSEGAFDAVRRLEDDLYLQPDVSLDGHDFGMGEMNIFVDTNDPLKTLKHVQLLMSMRTDLPNYRVGYRGDGDEAYTPIWPPELERFVVA